MNSLLPVTQRKPCPHCGTAIASKWPLCFRCKSKLTPSLQGSLMSGWRDRNNDSRMGLYFHNVLQECLESLRRIEADEKRLRGISEEVRSNY